MNSIAFTKMHGLGNDFVVVDCLAVDGPGWAIDAATARVMCDRRRGIGADGVLLIEPSTVADVAMRVLNADGSQPEMCGNGIRCVCKFVIDRGISDTSPLRIETGRGVLELEYERDDEGCVNSATVDMGVATSGPAAVGADASKLSLVDDATVSLDAGGQRLTGTLVSMGNPHVVVFVDDVAAVDLARLGPVVETHVAFPRRINVHFVQVNSRGRVTMRTWERGSGATMACGTGACAVCVAGMLTGRTEATITAQLPGGELLLRFDRASGNMFTTGPAATVYEGAWPGGAVKQHRERRSSSVKVRA